MKANPAYKSSMLWKTLVSTIALLLLTTAPLAAQDHGQQKQQEQQQQQEYQSEQKTKDVSKDELKKFAQAQPKLKQIRTEYAQEIKQVKGDNSKAKEIKDKYSQKMVDAIKNVGLTVQEYNEIAMAVQNNPKLQEKVSKMSQ